MREYYCRVQSFDESLNCTLRLGKLEIGTNQQFTSIKVLFTIA
jgi:hypothetical protein